MTGQLPQGWRTPSAREQRQDYAYLVGFLQPSLAARISAMPVVDIEPPCSARIHMEALMWRTRWAAKS